MLVVKEGLLSFLKRVVKPPGCFNFLSVDKYSHVIVFNISTIIRKSTLSGLSIRWRRWVSPSSEYPFLTNITG